MIRNRENIQTVRIGMRPMYMHIAQPSNPLLKKLLKNDPERKNAIQQDDGRTLLVPSRFHALVDERGNVLNTVTPRTYNPLANSEIIAALDIVSDEHGVDLTNTSSDYYNGRSLWKFTEQKPFKVPGDDSPHFSLFNVWHDGNGMGGLRAQGGIWRQWCTNGCTHKVIGTEICRVNHKVNVNLHEFFTGVVAEFVTARDELMELHQLAGSTEIDLRGDNAVRHALTSVYRSLAPRYRPRLSETIRRYTATDGGRDSVGPTVHALIQSISDMSEHQMQDGVTRHTWNNQATTEMVDALLAVTG